VRIRESNEIACGQRQISADGICVSRVVRDQVRDKLDYTFEDMGWETLRVDFRTRSILFECKNYKDPITADQVYSTERYLFSGALRTVCFLISRKHPDEGCKRAAQGALREAGKLILLLSNQDLITMLKLKAEEDGPTSYLDEKIWKFITTLPR
jgi:hypothetical protein